MKKKQTPQQQVLDKVKETLHTIVTEREYRDVTISVTLLNDDEDFRPEDASFVANVSYRTVSKDKLMKKEIMGFTLNDEIIFTQPI